MIRCLVEGNSIRATVRITGVAKNTVSKLLVETGYVCAEFQDKAFRDLNLKRIQCDEIWSFCYAKDKNLPTDKQDVFGYGSVWTWTAIDAETKLVPCWMVGPRDADSAHARRIFRCMVFPQNDGYIAECIDLNIAVQRPSPELAVDALEDAVLGYLEVAMQGDHAGLIPRPSPLSHRISYHLSALYCAIFRPRPDSWQFAMSSLQIKGLGHCSP